MDEVVNFEMEPEVPVGCSLVDLGTANYYAENRE